jgi:hypothetical protein
MDYIRKSEKVLKTYRRLKYSIRTLEKRKQRIISMGGPSENITSSLEITGIPGTGSTMPAEQLISELYSIEQALKATRAEMGIVDDVLRTISKEGVWWYGHLLRDWYIYKKTKKEIEKKYHTSERNAYNMRNQALQEFAVAYYGIPAAKKEEGTN